MDANETFGRLPELPEPTRSALRLALERAQAGAPQHEQTELYRAALVAAGMSTGDRERDLALGWMDPAALSPEQRGVAAILAHVPDDVLAYRIPITQRTRRRWLALDPPGPLFTTQIDGRPAYFALQARTPDEREALLSSMPAAQAIPLLVDMFLCGALWAGWVPSIFEKRSVEVDGSLGPWARGIADEMTTRYKPVGYPGAPPWLAFPVYLALARGRVPIDPRWEYFFPALFFARHPNESRECLEAVAPERRDVVLVAALRRFDPAGNRLAAALPILPIHPSPAIALFVRDNAHGAKKPLTPGSVNKTLKALAAEHPAIGAALGAKPTPITLTVARTRSCPRLDALNSSHEKQLEAAQERYGGKRLSAAALYAAAEPCDDQIHPSLLEHLELHRDGRHAYDLWRYMGDSGTLFVAGTDQVAGEIVQNHFECTDPELDRAVKAALQPSRSAAKRRPAKARAAKTKPATRAARPTKAKAKKKSS